MKTSLIFIGLIIISLIACKKDEVITKKQLSKQLPPISTEGKNTLGFLLNGEIWIPELIHSNSYSYYLISSYDTSNGSFNIKANRKYYNEINQSLLIAIDNLYTENEYILMKNSNSAAYGDQGCVYLTDSTQVGKVQIIKFDNVNHIIAGTFEMKLWKDGCDTINITEGRFDVKY